MLIGCKTSNTESLLLDGVYFQRLFDFYRKQEARVVTQSIIEVAYQATTSIILVPLVAYMGVTMPSPTLL